MKFTRFFSFFFFQNSTFEGTDTVSPFRIGFPRFNGDTVTSKVLSHYCATTKSNVDLAKYK